MNDNNATRNYDAMHVEFYVNTGIPKLIKYQLEGLNHNPKGPALVIYYESGKIKCQHYCIHGRLHRKGKRPAIIEYYENGIIKEIRYFKYGNMRSVNSKHRIQYTNEGIELN